jgi:hypothetical protein
MLAEEPMSFSKIQSALDIDSGHLSYHLENLGDLLSHSPEGQYKLSSIGNAAAKLMGGVEEPSMNHRSISLKKKEFNDALILSFILLVSILLFNSVFSIFAPRVSSDILSASYPQSVPLNGTINYNITIVYRTLPYENETSSISYAGLRDFFIETETPFQDLTHRTWDYIGFALKLNGTGSYRIRIYDPDNQLIWELLDPSLFINRVLSMKGSFAGTTTTLQYVSGETFNIVTRDKPGTYRISIEWVKTDQCHEALIEFEHTRQWIAWPLFYGGIIGILMSTVSPIFLIVLWIGMKSETINNRKKLVFPAFLILILALFLVGVLISVMYIFYS